MKRRYLRLIRRRNDGRERGAAVVEFAVVLPLLLTILFGIIEFGYVFMVRQTLQHAAREGCRLAILQTSVTPYANVSTRVSDVMATTNASSYTLAMTHATVGTPIESVTVSVPYDDVSLLGDFLGIGNFNLTGTASMRKEGM